MTLHPKVRDLIIGAAAGILAGLAGTSCLGQLEAEQDWTQGYQACGAEDDMVHKAAWPCYWDAKTMGNGEGTSFVLHENGTVEYFQPRDPGTDQDQRRTLKVKVGTPSKRCTFRSIQNRRKERTVSELNRIMEMVNQAIHDVEAPVRALIAEVKEHAMTHYEDGGWDVIYEAWSDNDIAEAIGRARTLKGALKKLAPYVEVYAERQADARISAGEEA